MATYEVVLGASAITDFTNAVAHRMKLTEGDGVTGQARIGDQIVKVHATCATSGGVFTLRFALVDNGATGTTKIIKYQDATCTASTMQGALAGGAGDYVCTIAFADGTDKFDCLGEGDAIKLLTAAGVESGTSRAGKTAWYVLPYVITTASGAITLRYTPTRVV